MTRNLMKWIATPAVLAVMVSTASAQTITDEHVQELIRLAAATRRRSVADAGARRRRHRRAPTPVDAVADARRRDQAGARSQPGYRRPAAEPADVRLLDREPAGVLQADADLDACAATRTTNPSTQTTSGAAAGTGIIQGHDHLQRRPRAEPAVGRRHRWSATLNNNTADHDQSDGAVQSDVQHQLVGAVHAAAAAQLQDRHQPAAAGRDEAESGHLRNSAAGADHQHRVERAERLLGLRVRGAVGGCRASGRWTSPSSW